MGIVILVNHNNRVPVPVISIQEWTLRPCKTGKLIVKFKAPNPFFLSGGVQKVVRHREKSIK